MRDSQALSSGGSNRRIPATRAVTRLSGERDSANVLPT
jgi:hypothetical protein